METAIKITGLTNNVNDGGTSQLFNLRYERGAMRPIGNKVQAYQHPDHTYIKYFLHRNSDYTHWIGWTGTALEWFNPADGTVTQVIDSNITDVLTIVALKGFVIVTQSSGLKRYLYGSSTGTYDLFDLDLPAVNIQFVEENMEGVSTAYGTDAAQVLNNIYKKENEMSAKGKMPGGVCVRWAFRLYDNTTIFPSQPVYVSRDTLGGIIGKDASGWISTFNVSGIKLTLTKDDLAFLNPIKDIVVGIDIFMSTPERMFKLDEFTLTTDVLPTADNTNSAMSDMFGWNPKFKTLHDAAVWYRVLQIDSVDVIGSGAYEKSIDLENYWTNYSSKVPLVVDSGSWHDLTGRTGFVYNGRLMLGEITTQLSENSIFDSSLDYSVLNTYSEVHTPPGSTVYRFKEAKPGKTVTYVKTDEGEKTVVADVPINIYEECTYDGTNFTPTGSTTYKTGLPGILWYPDERANKMDIIVFDGTNYRLVKSINLKSSDYYNYAFALNFTWDLIGFDYTTRKQLPGTNYAAQIITFDITAITVYAVPAQDNVLTDTNRIQASELNNPFVFPAENSYSLSGKVLGMAANTEPLSQGQFGQHPVQVLTDQGTWAMVQGSPQAGVLFASIVPSSSEVALSNEVLPVRGGIVFFSQRGIIFLSGKDAKIISLSLEGEAINPIAANASYQSIMQLDQLSTLLPEISDHGSILDYVNSARLAYNSTKDELIVINPLKLSSYVYSFRSGMWSLINKVYAGTINAWPQSFLQDAAGVIYHADQERTDQAVQVMYQTNPLINNNPVSIQRAKFRASIQSIPTVYTGFYIFGAERNNNWFLLGGVQTQSKIKDFETGAIGRSAMRELVLIFTANVYPTEDVYIEPVVTLVVTERFTGMKKVTPV